MEINIQELTLLSKEEYESNKDKAPFWGKTVGSGRPATLRKVRQSYIQTPRSADAVSTATFTLSALLCELVVLQVNCYAFLLGISFFL